MEKAVFNDIRIREHGRVFSRLADLIDPVCKPHITSEILTESITKYTAECSNCGAIFGDFPTMEQVKTTHPVYCPSCGARVVRDDDMKRTKDSRRTNRSPVKRLRRQSNTCPGNVKKGATMKAIKVLLVFIDIYFLVFCVTCSIFLAALFLWENVKHTVALPVLVLSSFVTTFRITFDLVKSDYF